MDVLHILVKNVPVEESDEDKPGVILDYDKEGNIVGIEILDASKLVEDPPFRPACRDALTALPLSLRLLPQPVSF